MIKSNLILIIVFIFFPGGQVEEKVFNQFWNDFRNTIIEAREENLETFLRLPLISYQIDEQIADTIAMEDIGIGSGKIFDDNFIGEIKSINYLDKALYFTDEDYARLYIDSNSIVYYTTIDENMEYARDLFFVMVRDTIKFIGWDIFK